MKLPSGSLTAAAQVPQTFHRRIISNFSTVLDAFQKFQKFPKIKEIYLYILIRHMPTLHSHFFKFSFNFPFSFLHFSMTALQHCN